MSEDKGKKGPSRLRRAAWAFGRVVDTIVTGEVQTAYPEEQCKGGEVK